MAKGFNHVSAVECRLVRNMKKEGLPWKHMVRTTGRSTDTLNKIVHRAAPLTKGIAKGAPRKVTAQAFSRARRAMLRLQKERHPKGQEVTADMILAHSGLDVSTRTLLREFRHRNIKFYRLKHRQTLTPADVKERKAWAQAFKARTASV